MQQLLCAAAMEAVSSGRAHRAAEHHASVRLAWAGAERMKVFEVFSWPDVLTATFDGRVLAMLVWAAAGGGCRAWAGRFLSLADDEGAPYDRARLLRVLRGAGAALAVVAWDDGAVERLDPQLEPAHEAGAGAGAGAARRRALAAISLQPPVARADERTSG